jgi:putative endonuclease
VTSTPVPVQANRARGAWGERLVASWYEARGFVVVERNWRCSFGEIDLVVARDELVVFCEVKARRTGAFGTGVEAVSAAKRRRLRRLGAAWLAASPHRAFEVRFDVAAVDGTRVNVVEDAF